MKRIEIVLFVMSIVLFFAAYKTATKEIDKITSYGVGEVYVQTIRPFSNGNQTANDLIEYVGKMTGDENFGKANSRISEKVALYEKLTIFLAFVGLFCLLMPIYLIYLRKKGKYPFP